MKQQLARLREKPQHIRERYAYGGAAGIALSIFLIWGISLVVTKPFAYENVKDADANIAREESNPFAELSEGFKAGLAGVGGAYNQIEEVRGRYEGEARLEVVGAPEMSDEEEAQTDRPTVYTF